MGSYIASQLELAEGEYHLPRMRQIQLYLSQSDKYHRVCFDGFKAADRV